MMSVYVFLAALALMNQRITGLKQNKDESNNNQKDQQNLKDLVNWWDHESPDWAKSAEDSDDISDYYHPVIDSHYSSEEEDNDKNQRRNPNVEFRPNPCRHSPPDNDDDSKNLVQNTLRPLTFEETDNTQWFKSFSFQNKLKPSAINGSPDFTRTPRPDKAVTRFARQSANKNIEQCMRNCPTTSEYNPVCGTDNITYSNEGRLACARYCGVDVSIWRRSSCPDTGSAVNENNNASQRPPSNTPTAMDVVANINTLSPSLQSCLNNCPRRGEIAPVCGSDGITYDSPGHLLCAQICGLDVKVRQLSACPNNNVVNNFGEISDPNNMNTNPLSNTGSNSANSIVISLEPKPNINNPGNAINNDNDKGFSFNRDRVTTTIAPHIRFCLQSCPTNNEHNPVCGSNRIIYSNPGRLQCAKICGSDVQRRPLSFCQPTTAATTTTTTTTASPEPITNPPVTQNPLECTKSCRLTNETKPVCGTNGVTYRNIEHLQCIKMCGAEVEVKSYVSCQDEATVTPSHAALNNSRLTTESTPQPNPNNRVNFTIPPDVLENVFQMPGVTTESEIEDSFIRIND